MATMSTRIRDLETESQHCTSWPVSVKLARQTFDDLDDPSSLLFSVKSVHQLLVQRSGCVKTIYYI